LADVGSFSVMRVVQELVHLRKGDRFFS
jgi:hypothetical protein